MIRVLKIKARGTIKIMDRIFKLRHFLIILILIIGIIMECNKEKPEVQQKTNQVQIK